MTSHSMINHEMLPDDMTRNEHHTCTENNDMWVA